MSLPPAPSSPPVTDEPLVRGIRLSKFFTPTSTDGAAVSLIRAVEDASLCVRAGETLGVIGESGSGKTTLGRMTLRLVEPSYGRLLFEGVDITHHNERDLRRLRRRMQMIFQDTPASLNPTLSVAEIVAEPLRIHGLEDDAPSRRERVVELLRGVGLSSRILDRRPRELSSGECQRVGIARALSLRPAFVVCDEPLGALDPADQAQVIDLLVSLQEQHDHGYLFISHDVRMVMHVSHQVAVMYAGRIVERGPALGLWTDGAHPYTRALMSAVPALDPTRRQLRVVLEGDPPSPLGLGSGCAFEPRCPHARPGLCDREAPPLARVGRDASHEVACFRAHD